MWRGSREWLPPARLLCICPTDWAQYELMRPLTFELKVLVSLCQFTDETSVRPPPWLLLMGVLGLKDGKSLIPSRKSKVGKECTKFPLFSASRHRFRVAWEGQVPLTFGGKAWASLEHHCCPTSKQADLKLTWPPCPWRPVWLP